MTQKGERKAARRMRLSQKSRASNKVGRDFDEGENLESLSEGYVSRVSRGSRPMISRRIWEMHGSGRITGWAKAAGLCDGGGWMGAGERLVVELHEHKQAQAQTP